MQRVSGSAMPMFHRDRYRPDYGFTPQQLYVMQRMIGRFTVDQLIAMRLGLREGEVHDLLIRAVSLDVVTLE